MCVQPTVHYGDTSRKLAHQEIQAAALSGKSLHEKNRLLVYFVAAYLYLFSALNP